MMFHNNRFNEKVLNVADFASLLKILTKQENWKKLDIRVLNIIFENAQSKLTDFINGSIGNSALEKVQNFICFCEENKCLDKKFLDFIQRNNPTNALSRISSRIRSNGDNFLYDLQTNELNDKQAEKYLVVTELSYKYAILSDPFNLSAHFSLANLYLLSEAKESAAEICLLYDLSEEKLLSSPVSDDDEKRNMQYESLKENYSGMLTDIRNQIDTIKREVGLPIIERLNIPEDTTSEEEKEMTRKSVEKLTRQWYPKWVDEKDNNDDEMVYCTTCKKSVKPTFHGLCPNCDNAL